MRGRPTVVSAGYMPLDIIRTLGGLTSRNAGGTAGNVAAILAFLGWDSTLAGQAGADIAGDALVSDLSKAGVHTSQISRQATIQTARLVHDVRPHGHFFSYRCPDCAARFPNSRPLTLDGAAVCSKVCPFPTVFFFDRANAGTIELAEHYGKAGSVIVFEPSVPANADLLSRAAAIAHIIKHSDDRSVGGLRNLHVRPRQRQVRIVTHGAEGLEVMIGPRRSHRLPALATLAVDTGGAGDWTTAGFLAKAARGGEIEMDGLDDALRFGQALAAVNCATVGSRGLMGITPNAALRRARKAMEDGGVTTEPRMPTVAVPGAPAGVCATCLMPRAEQLTFRVEAQGRDTSTHLSHG